MLPLLGQQLWATVSLTSWYLRFLAELNTLPEWVKNPDTMQRTLDEGGSLVYRLNNGVRDRYNAGIKELGDTIKQAGAGWYSFNTM